MGSCARFGCSLVKGIRRRIRKAGSWLLTFLFVDPSTAWAGRQGPFLICYVLYGVGSSFMEEEDVAPWHIALLWYGLAAGLGWACLVAWVKWWKGRFEHSKEEQRLEASALDSYVGVTGVFLVTLAAQMFPMGLIQRPDESILWAVSFAVISSAIAGLGSYFFIGYPGMASLHVLDQRAFGQEHSQGLPEDLPAQLVAGLQAELDMLGRIIAGVIYFNVFAAAGIVLGLDRIGALFDAKTFTDVSSGGQLWFISGVSLLFFACHASITGPVHGRYYDIARWLRHSGTRRNGR